MSEDDEPNLNTRPTPGYLATIALGCAGLAFLGVGLGGALIGRAGGDTFDALDVDGMVMFLLGFAIMFASRLIFWPPAPASLRRLVRSAIAIVFSVGVLACVVSVFLALQMPLTTKNGSMPLYFSILAALCQIASVLWLTRYRREGV